MYQKKQILQRRSQCHQAYPPDEQQILALYTRMQGSRAKIVGSDGKTRRLPGTLQKFLGKLVDDLAEGQSVAIIQEDTQLTTVEAARQLGVSRQFLVKLLNQGAIPYHLVGTHRRIYTRHLLAYKARRDSSRRQILDTLSRAEAEDGLYDLAPVHAR